MNEVQRRQKQKRDRRGRAKPIKHRALGLRENLRELRVVGASEGRGELVMSPTTTAEGRGAKPAELLGLLEVESGSAGVVRTETRFREVGVARGEVDESVDVGEAEASI